MTPPACILDLDGTLVDTIGDFVAVLGLTLADLGLPAVDRAFVERTIGRGGEHLVRQTLAQVGAKPGLFDHAWSLYQAHYATVNGQHAAVYPGVVEGLEAMQTGHRHFAEGTGAVAMVAGPLQQQGNHVGQRSGHALEYYVAIACDSR